MKFQVEFKSSAIKELQKIQHQDALKIKNAITKLSTNPLPNGVKKLRKINTEYE